MKKDIKPSELRELLQSQRPPRVIDVRTPAEYQACHIDGAQNLPLDTIDGDLPGVSADEPVVLVCKGGMRSSAACLRVQGAHKNLMNLVGGTDGWVSAGLPTACGG